MKIIPIFYEKILAKQVLDLFFIFVNRNISNSFQYDNPSEFKVL